MRTLYEITGLFKELYESDVEENEISEESWFDNLESLEMELNEKAENTAIVYKQFCADAEAMKNEEDHLKERRHTIEHKAERLKFYLMNMLTAAGKDKIEGTKAKISITKGRESIVISDAEKLIAYPSVWKEYKYVEDNVSKTEVGLLLDAGIEIEGAERIRRPGIIIK